MCGIVGIIGREPVAGRLVEALRRLEYRGYDSAGIATLSATGLDRRRAGGKLDNLEQTLANQPLEGTIGIGHTRWATHGGATEINAHPHMAGQVAVVHNGIIENFRELLKELGEEGYFPDSETDTEAVALLVARELARGAAPREAVGKTLSKLRGTFGLVFLFAEAGDLLIAARQGSPLAIGHGEDEMYLGSDAFALAPFTNKITYLEEGDWAVLTRTGAEIFDFDGKPVERKRQDSSASAVLADKGSHRHFMAKEIFEQPETVSHTLAHYVDLAEERVGLREALPFDFASLSRLTITACGTAYYAALVARYWFERYAKLPVDVDVASEFRYREPPLPENGLTLVISQSGETADTLAALRYAARSGQHVAALVNVRESTIARESHVVFPTLCGPEIGVASTKAFTAQLTALAGLCIAAGQARGVLSSCDAHALIRALAELPSAISEALRHEAQIEAISRHLARASDVLYLGRGQMFPLALEGALKLKEISYIHAEGYAAGELKHGPIALIDENMPVIVIAPHDRIFEKTVSNMQEVAARGGKIILVTDAKGAAHATISTMETIVLPDIPEIIAPIVYALPIQMLAYYTAVFMGTDVDQPRNLAKSVTVE